MHSQVSKKALKISLASGEKLRLQSSLKRHTNIHKYSKTSGLPQSKTHKILFWHEGIQENTHLESSNHQFVFTHIAKK